MDVTLHRFIYDFHQINSNNEKIINIKKEGPFLFINHFTEKLFFVFSKIYLNIKVPKVYLSYS